MEHSYYSQAGNPSDDAKASLQAAAATFSQTIQDATSKLTAAAEQFGSMSEGLLSAVDDACSAAEKAQAAQKETEATQERLTALMRQLQERLSGLAALAQSFDLPAEASAETSPANPAGEPTTPQTESHPW